MADPAKRSLWWAWALAWLAWAVASRFGFALLAEAVAPWWLKPGSFFFRVLWALLAIPLPFVAGVLWSMRREAAERARLVETVLRGDPGVLGAALELLAVVATEGDSLLGQRLFEALQTRSAQLPTAGLAALEAAMQAWRNAAGFGSGAFHGDGWASLGLMEKQEAVAGAARALAPGAQDPA